MSVKVGSMGLIYRPRQYAPPSIWVVASDQGLDSECSLSAETFDYPSMATTVTVITVNRVKVSMNSGF
jgi:hypothetical protein